MDSKLLVGWIKKSIKYMATKKVVEKEIFFFIFDMIWSVAHSFRDRNQTINLLSKWSIKWKENRSRNIRQDRLEGILWANGKGIPMTRHDRPTPI